jgi:myosin V
VTLLPGLPAYVLFMCIRYTDHINDEDKVKLLLKFFINGVKKLIKKKGNELDSTILWLANTLRCVSIDSLCCDYEI